MYGFCKPDYGQAIIIDTGGLGGDQGEVSQLIARQVELAVEEADVVLFMLEAGTGLTTADENIATLLRKSGKEVLLAVNKAEGLPADETAAEYWSLGMGEPYIISATRGDRIKHLVESALQRCPVRETADENVQRVDGVRIAVIGRPNVGKSTLINRLIGEERLVTQDEAGTTRDSIFVPFETGGKRYVLIDTAGIRRRAKVTGVIEKFSIVKSLAAIDEADAAMVLLDARDGVTEQDVSLIGLVLERGRALTIGVNKWDGLTSAERGKLRSELDRRLPFLDFVDQHFISALHGSNIHDLLSSADNGAKCAFVDMSSGKLTAVLTDAVIAHPTPMVRGRRIKLSYAHQGGRNPPVVVVHGNQTERLPMSYKRYLAGKFRKAFRLRGTPMRLQLVTSRNPYAGKRNKLTPRQERRRERLRNPKKR